jgi:ArsR family transcriptional regulator
VGRCDKLLRTPVIDLNAINVELDDARVFNQSRQAMRTAEGVGGRSARPGMSGLDGSRMGGSTLGDPMDKKTLRLNQNRATIIKALAHPSRLFIVDVLSERAYCVHELTEFIGCDMSTVSKHLSVLKNAGLVQDKKRGTAIYYSMRVPHVLKFLKCTDAVIKAVLKEDMSLV